MTTQTMTRIETYTEIAERWQADGRPADPDAVFAEWHRQAEEMENDVVRAAQLPDADDFVKAMARHIEARQAASHWDLWR